MENELVNSLDQIHTTALGEMRIKRNLALDTNNVVAWCKEKIALPDAQITRNGKNWHADVGDCIITVNAFSYTIITAHQKGRS